MARSLIKVFYESSDMPTIIHFEIPTDDLERSKKFYSELFGWNFEKYSLPEGMDYLIITTTDDQGNKSIGGGMMKRQNPQHVMTNYIGVKSVDEYSTKISQSGGKVVMSKKSVPGMGYFAICLDTENNSFGIWETDPNAK